MVIQQQIMEKIKLRNSIMVTDYEMLSNPDFIHRKKIEEAVKNNEGYCPCKLEKNEDTRCPCKEFRKDEKTGFCHCGRYYKVVRSPKVCLCGSTRFKDKFIEIARDLTLKGCIVTMPMVFVHNGDEVTETEKKFLDEVHKAKISDADIIYVINVDGYIGNSTRSEINWAAELGKKIEYLES